MFQPDAILLTTKQISLEPRDAEIVFGTSTYNRVAVNGPLVGLIFSGTRVIYSCHKVSLSTHDIKYTFTW